MNLVLWYNVSARLTLDNLDSHWEQGQWGRHFKQDESRSGGLRYVGNSEGTSYLPPLRYCLTLVSTMLESCGEKPAELLYIYWTAGPLLAWPCTGKEFISISSPQQSCEVGIVCSILHNRRPVTPRGVVTWLRSPKEKVVELGSELVVVRLFSWLCPAPPDL